MNKSKICPTCGSNLPNWATRCPNCDQKSFEKEILDPKKSKAEIRKQNYEQKAKAKEKSSIESATKWQEKRDILQNFTCEHEDIEFSNLNKYFCTACKAEISETELAQYEDVPVVYKRTQIQNYEDSDMRQGFKIIGIGVIILGVAIGGFFLGASKFKSDQYKTGDYLNSACDHVTSALLVHSPRGAFRRISQEEYSYYKSEMRLAAKSFRLAAQEDEYAAELAIYANQMANGSKGLASDGYSIPVIDFCGEGQD